MKLVELEQGNNCDLTILMIDYLTFSIQTTSLTSLFRKRKPVAKSEFELKSLTKGKKS